MKWWETFLVVDVFGDVCLLCPFSQECDQVHIDDVSSDDNGQDLR